MLLFLVVIPLTIAAWKRGWKGWALVPLVLPLAAVFVAGCLIGIMGPTDDEASGMVLVGAGLGGVLWFGALVAMIVKGRKPKVTINPVVGPLVGLLQPAGVCGGCGSELHDNATFCRNCGQKVGQTLRGDLPVA